MLLVAGDIDTALLERTIARHFGPWKLLANAPRNARDEFKPYDRVRAAVLTDPEITDADVMVFNLKPLIEKKTMADFRRQIADNLGTAMIDRRLARLINAGRVPFTRASIDAVPSTCDILAVTAQASGQTERWEAMLESLVIEVGRAQAHGFRENELDDQRRDLLASLEHAVAAEPTRESLSFMGAMNDALETGSIPITTEQELALSRELLTAISVAEVSETFRKDFSPETRLYIVTLPDKKSLPIPTEAEVLNIARTAKSDEVVAIPVRPRPFLERDPAPGRIVRQKEETDTQVVSATFANGVHLHVRHMDEQKDIVHIVVNLAGGELRETAKNRGISAVAHLALLYPSTDSHSPSDIEDLLMGRNFFVIGYGLQGQTRLDIMSSPADLEDALRLAHLLITRARIDKERFRIWRKKILRGIERRQYSTSSQLGIRLNQFYAGGDPRFAPLQPADIERLTLEAGQAWLDRLLRTVPIEVAMVGDIPANRALALGAKYFGSLPRRSETDPTLEPLRKIALKPGAVEASISVTTETPRAEVYVGWRGTDLRNVQHHRALSLAASILTRRLFDEVRAKRGYVYGIGCASVAADVYPGLGRFGVSFATDPDKATEVANLVHRLVEQFAAEGPTAEELEIARKQLFVGLNERRRNPATWASHLSAHRYFGSGEILTERDREPVN